jgi:hypothetical protein
MVFQRIAAKESLKFVHNKKTMNLKNQTLLAALILMGASVMISSCKDDYETSDPAITSVSPESGIVGSTVTITGHHFSETPAGNEVKFNGTAAIVSSSSHTEIVTTVPAGATTGKITVTIDGTTLTSPNDFVVLVPSEITSIEPSQGVAGTVVVISGSNFSTTAADNIVKFGGNAQAEVIDASATELVVEVPETATTGMMSITVKGAPATGASNFTILAPTITSFDPMLGGEGLSVKIKGTNFSTTEAYNKVKFNNVSATVTEATSTQLIATVPAGATSGKITVQVGPNTATSAEEFFVCNNAELAIFSGQAIASLDGASISYEFTLINYGKETIDLNQWGYQNYVSVDQVVNGGDEGGGGSTLAGQGTLATGQSKKITGTVTRSAIGFNYFIFTIDVENGETVTECLTNNNELSVLIQK